MGHTVLVDGRILSFMVVVVVLLLLLVVKVL